MVESHNMLVGKTRVFIPVGKGMTLNVVINIFFQINRCA